MWNLPAPSSLRWCQTCGLQRRLLSQRQSQKEDQLLQRTCGALACHLRDRPVSWHQPQREPVPDHRPARVTHPGTVAQKISHSRILESFRGSEIVSSDSFRTYLYLAVVSRFNTCALFALQHNTQENVKFCKKFCTVVSYRAKALFSNASCIELLIALPLCHCISLSVKMTQAFFLSASYLRWQIKCTKGSDSWQILDISPLRIYWCLFAQKMINRNRMCCYVCCPDLNLSSCFFFFLSCPGVVPEQKSSHPEVQRSQEGAVAGW